MERAAALQRRSLDDFLIAAALDTAKGIAEQAIVRLAPEDQRTLAVALLAEETEEPSPSRKSCLTNTCSGYVAPFEESDRHHPRILSQVLFFHQTQEGSYGNMVDNLRCPNRYRRAEFLR